MLDRAGDRDLARRSSAALPYFSVSMACSVPMVGKQIKIVKGWKGIDKGGGHP